MPTKAQDKEEEESTEVAQLPQVMSAEDVYAEFQIDKDNAFTEDEKRVLAQSGAPFFILLCELLDGGKKHEKNPKGLFWILTVDFMQKPKKLFMSWREDTDAEFQGYRIVTEQRKMAVGPMRLNITLTNAGYDFYFLTGYRAIEVMQQDKLPF